ncbi:MAG: hypothetical protein A2341_08170 [Deltaproteobacteria bacterium RIFOXYB12_FULL_58_9]|nr:MAG: hypothetical protein A2341_08170 [Deltaproteobacteria bacterium RIFOXYB12_FULL_58_9]
MHLTVLLTLIAAAHLAWLHVDESPPGSDEAMYAKAALRFSDAVTGKGTVSYRALFDPAGSRQPIPVWTAGIAVLLGADDPVRAGRALNFIPLFMLGFGVFALSRRLGGKGDLALLAATLSCLYLPLVHLSRHFWAHYWLVAVLPLALWALLRTESFADRRRSIQFGLIAAVGLLIRHFFVLFALPAAMVVTTMAFFSAKPAPPKRALINMGWALGVLVAISTLHYAESFGTIRHLLKSAGDGTASCRGTDDALWEFFAGLPLDLFWGGSPWIGCVLAVCLVATVIAARRDRQLATCSATILVVFVIRYVYPCRVLSYAAPIVPILFATGSAVFGQRWPRATRSLMIASAMWMVALVARDFNPTYEHSPVVVSAPARWLPSTMAPQPRPPIETHLQEALAHLRKLPVPQGGKPRLITFAATPFEKNRLALELRAAKDLHRVSNFDQPRLGMPYYIDFVRLLSANAIISQNVPVNSPGTAHRLRNVLKPVFAELASRGDTAFNYVVTLRLPTDPEIVVWHQTRAATDMDIRAALEATLRRGNFDGAPDTYLAMQVEEILRTHLDDHGAAMTALAELEGENRAASVTKRLRCMLEGDVPNSITASLIATVFGNSDSTSARVEQCFDALGN